jgi:nucleotide-binding universal stress UspA family protein
MTASPFRWDEPTPARPSSQQGGNANASAANGRLQPLRIVCAVDASPRAVAAFEQALSMSARRGAQLVLVHAVSKDERYSWGAVERVAALADLRRRAEALNVPVRVRVQQGDTAAIILLHARAHAADLIVLGAHEPAGLSRLRFGSIADRVVEGASCPVLLVPGKMTRVTPLFRRIVSAIDPSSRLAVRGPSAATGPDARQQLHWLLDHPAPDTVVTVASDAVVDEILRVAGEQNADLIVFGATRRPRLGRRFLGSTALRTSRRSLVPVLVLPATHRKRELSTLDEAALGWAA